MIPSDQASPLVGMAGMTRELSDRAVGRSPRGPVGTCYPACPWAGRRSRRAGTRGPRDPRLSPPCTYCPIRTAEPGDTVLLIHPAGSSASKQTYC